MISGAETWILAVLLALLGLLAALRLPWLSHWFSFGGLVGALVGLVTAFLLALRTQTDILLGATALLLGLSLGTAFNDAGRAGVWRWRFGLAGFAAGLAATALSILWLWWFAPVGLVGSAGLSLAFWWRRARTADSLPPKAAAPPRPPLAGDRAQAAIAFRMRCTTCGAVYQSNSKAPGRIPPCRRCGGVGYEALPIGAPAPARALNKQGPSLRR
ncbi:MAG: hypothetical protein QOC71_751 [Thermoplasmata archaeon]|jgi:rubredoxin|nr:hypothetical protein [Thermoplasmata archaeon]